MYVVTIPQQNCSFSVFLRQFIAKSWPLLVKVGYYIIVLLMDFKVTGSVILIFR